MNYDEATSADVLLREARSEVENHGLDWRDFVEHLREQDARGVKFCHVDGNPNVELHEWLGRPCPWANSRCTVSIDGSTVLAWLGY